MLKALTVVTWQGTAQDRPSILVSSEPDLRHFPPRDLLNLCSSLFFSSRERSYYVSEAQVTGTIHEMTRGVVDVDALRITCLVCAMGTAYLRNSQPIEAAGFKRRQLAEGLASISKRLEKYASPVSVSRVKADILSAAYSYLNGDIEVAWRQIYTAFASIMATGMYGILDSSVGSSSDSDHDKLYLYVAIQSLTSRIASMTGRPHILPKFDALIPSHPFIDKIASSAELTAKVDTDIVQNPKWDLTTVQQLEMTFQSIRSINLDEYPIHEEIAHIHLMRIKMHAAFLDKRHLSQVDFISALGDLLLHLETLQQQSQRETETLYRNRPNLSYVVFQVIMTIWMQCLTFHEPSTFSDQLQVMKSRYLDFSTRLHLSSPLCRTSAAVYEAMQQLESKQISHLDVHLELPILGPIGEQSGLDVPLMADSELWAFLASIG